LGISISRAANALGLGRGGSTFCGVIGRTQGDSSSYFELEIFEIIARHNFLNHLELRRKKVRRKRAVKNLLENPKAFQWVFYSLHSVENFLYLLTLSKIVQTHRVSIVSELGGGRRY
jgi:hypothetical protein